MGCRLDDSLSYRGVRALALENELLRVVVLVDKGTDLYEFTWKPAGINLLWQRECGVRNPATFLPDSPTPSFSFLDYYEGGWQECFPNGGGTSRYRGAEIGTHGEVCKVPWDVETLERGPARVRVRFEVRTMRLPFRLEKILTLEEGSPVLSIRERAVNESPLPAHYLWGHHPCFGPPFLSPRTRLAAPARKVRVHPAPIGGRERFAHGAVFDWPEGRTADGKAVDLSWTPRPEERVQEMLYLTDLADGWFAMTNLDLRVGFGMRFPKEVFRNLWLWREIHGTDDYPWFSRYYLAAVEPFTTAPGLGLGKSVENGTAPVLGPHESLDIEILATAFSGATEPRKIDGLGRVEFES